MNRRRVAPSSPSALCMESCTYKHTWYIVEDNKVPSSYCWQYFFNLVYNWEERPHMQFSRHHPSCHWEWKFRSKQLALRISSTLPWWRCSTAWRPSRITQVIKNSDEWLCEWGFEIVGKREAEWWEHVWYAWDCPLKLSSYTSWLPEQLRLIGKGLHISGMIEPCIHNLPIAWSSWKRIGVTMKWQNRFWHWSLALQFVWIVQRYCC